MAKFVKRLRKLSKNSTNALVIGSGFGHLGEFVQAFDTVFITDHDNTDFKARNLVYREDISDLTSLADIGLVIIDLNKLELLSKAIPICLKFTSTIIVEGNEVLSIEKSKLLYNYHYGAVDRQESYHVWKRIK